MKNKVNSIFCIVLALLICFSCTACRENASETVQFENNPLSDSALTLGKGDTVFTFSVVTADGTETRFNIFTKQKTVGAALQEVNLIAGDAGPYGLYVKTVNGVTYDYEKDGKYWAFYINDTYAASSVDKTEIEHGCTYSFKAE